jgi:hypothetical protein
VLNSPNITTAAAAAIPTSTSCSLRSGKPLGPKH